MSTSKGRSTDPKPNAKNDDTKQRVPSPSANALKERNAFDANFLERLDQQEAPPHTYASLSRGPWSIRPTPDGMWACYAQGEATPAAVLEDRSLAYLCAAALPASAGLRCFALRAEHGRHLVLDRGTPVGSLTFVDEELVASVDLLAAILVSPQSLAYVLLAAGAPVLERAGRILEQIVDDRE